MNRRAFILVVTLALLALLVLAIIGIVASARIGGQLAYTQLRRTTARQHALLALGIAAGELQRHAGDEAATTAMAGVTGVTTGVGGNGTRHWCGAWRDRSSPPVWLASGTQRAPLPGIAMGLKPARLVGANTVGAEATNSEYVIAGAIPVTDPSGRVQGSFAWWVGDEGVKIPARATAGSARFLVPRTPAAANTLRDALATGSNLSRALTYEQLRFLPSPAAPLALGVLRDTFHSATLESVGGRINVNTTNILVWRSIFETGALATNVAITSSQLETAARRMQNSFATGNGGRPFISVEEFAGSDLLADALAGLKITPADFMGALGGALQTRSETFRVRTYGDATDVDGTAIEAAARCEAIFTRAGGRFVMKYFRWLGPDDT